MRYVLEDYTILTNILLNICNRVKDFEDDMKIWLMDAIILMNWASIWFQSSFDALFWKTF
jgi:hypothetical protein